MTHLVHGGGATVGVDAKGVLYRVGWSGLVHFVISLEVQLFFLRLICLLWHLILSIVENLGGTIWFINLFAFVIAH